MYKIKACTRKILSFVLSEERIFILSVNLRYCLKILITLLYSYRGQVFLRRQKGNQKKMPIVLQFPITNKCNLKCKMCSVPEMAKNDMNVEQVKKALQDKLFSEIISVGVNGGEPFLRADLEQFIDAILALPKIKSINIISNGILTQRILERLKLIHIKCKAKGVRVGITFSLDGYKDVHDTVRGVKGAFVKTVSTIKAIQSDINSYCEHIGIICTISNYNIYSLNELVAFAELNNLPKIDYQLAVEHKRLDNANKYADFSVLTNPYHKMLAMEFFYALFLKTQENNYYFIYKYLESNCTNRMMSCPWADRDVTINASGGLCYCAVNSKEIGNVDDESLYDRFFDQDNFSYRTKLVHENCNSCIHYNNSEIYFKSYIDINSHLKLKNTWTLKYMIKGRKMR